MVFLTLIGYLLEERRYLTMMKLVLNGQNIKNIPRNLQLKVAETKSTSRKNPLMLIRKNDNIKSVYI